MKNKALQEKRMKGYFIQATKTILKGEGIKGISVRNIADEAGYSYATLYNYFKDVKDLIFECVIDFQEECHTFIELEVKEIPPGKKRIKQIGRSYVKFFVQYPGIFELFFIERLASFSNGKKTTQKIFYFLDELCEEDWQYCRNNGLLTVEEIEIKKAAIRYTTSGLLLFYINRREPASYPEFMEEMERQLSSIIS